ncbi:hypothetical protein [Endozoicomonas sp. SCSIO W0465]|uniref:hypothetical protein n=1 Tax=Endozoicomonas sp. SCSIO W0465 TaxID=2918516 RepID=UPI0020765133|nr:hypothetical protein [Endozoicomonas sp. SCSIO W0465]USE36716.1 hypothetical protein MJO57_00250 [Endozoicomonas sp. SCSIO W0465]
MFNIGNFVATNPGCHSTFTSTNGTTVVSSSAGSEQKTYTHINDTSVKRDDVNIAGNVHSESQVILNRSQVGGFIEAGMCVELDQSQVKGNIKAGTHVSLDRSQVEGSIEAMTYVAVRRSQVQGSVSAQSPITIDRSQISHNVTSPHKLTINSSRVEGFLKTGGSFTKIDQNSYINEVIIEPHIQEMIFSTQPIKQTIEINHQSTVGNITFKSGNGEVLVKNGSKVTGKVTGGHIKYEQDEAQRYSSTPYGYGSIFVEPGGTVRFTSVSSGGRFTFTAGGSYKPKEPRERSHKPRERSHKPQENHKPQESHKPQENHKPKESHKSEVKKYTRQSIAKEIGYDLKNAPATDYRIMAFKAHPDRGGSTELMQELNRLYNK